MEEDAKANLNGNKEPLNAIVKCEIDLDENFSSDPMSCTDHIDEAMVEKIKPDAKEPYVCEGCGKGFCYVGWLDRHKLTMEECSHLPLSNVQGKDGLLNLGPSTSSLEKVIKNYSKSVVESILKNDYNLSRKRSFLNEKRQNNQERSSQKFDSSNSDCDYQTTLNQNVVNDVTNGVESKKDREVVHDVNDNDEGPIAGVELRVEEEENIEQGEEVLVEQVEHDNSLIVKPSFNVTCSICSKKYTDVHEHIEHMTEVHQMKASFRCSTCGETFSTKLAVEAHLQNHAQTFQDLNIQEQEVSAIDYSKSLDDVQQEYIIENIEYLEETSDKADLSQLSTVDVIEEEEDFSDKDILDDVYNCVCGKAYLLKSSYEQHLKVCTIQGNSKTVENKLEPSKSTSKFKSQNSSMHCRRDLVEKLHLDGDLHCKACLRPSRSVLCVHNHLSRMNSCREYYCTVLFPTLNLDDLEEQGDYNFTPKRSRNSLSSWPRSNNKNDASFDADSNSTLSKRNLTSTQSNYKSLPSSTNIFNSSLSYSIQNTKFDTNTSTALKLEKNVAKKNHNQDPIQCPRCLKVFSGKSPSVAYTNHIRSYRPCNPPNSEVQNEIFDYSFSSSQMGQKTYSKSSQDLSNLSFDADKSRNVVYFCKLCPNRDIKNRVTLGTHLTQYHGLPPVNINTPEGSAMRCQTCCQTFTSKYFYNMHRYDCDKTSPYVGILLSDGTELNCDPDYPLMKPNENISQGLTTSSSSSNHQNELSVRSPFLSETFKCSLCNKTGFLSLSSIKMHQRYQCIKRDSTQLSKSSSHFTSMQRISFQRNRRGRKPASKISQTSKTYANRTISSSSGAGGAANNSSTGAYKKVYYSEIARLNDLAKSDNSLTMCDACGRGPYNSYYYLLDHQNKFCRALKKNFIDPYLNPSSSKYQESNAFSSRANKSLPGRKPNVAKKSLPNSETASAIVPQIAKKSFQNSNKVEKNLNIDKNESSEEDIFTCLEELDLDQYFDCSQCDLKSNNIVQFIVHRLKHIGQDLDISLSDQTYFCELCKGKFMTSQHQKMQTHLLFHLKTFKNLQQRSLIELRNKELKKAEIEESDDEEHLLTCPYCKSNFVSRIALANHIKTSCPFRYQCNKCSRTYLTKESFIDHKENCPGDSSLNSVRASCICKHCGLRFKSKSRLVHHQQVCFKVFNADISSKLEQIIQNASTCSICGLVAKNYQIKSKHEFKCLERAVTNLGFKFSLIKNAATKNDESDIEFESFSESSEINSIDQSEVLEPSKITEEINKHGIEKEIKINLNRLEDETDSNDLPQKLNDETQFDHLRKNFTQLLNHLITDENILKEIMNEDAIETVLIRMLTHMGEEPERNDKLDDLTRFRVNIQSFLSLSIKAETLEKAYYKAKSIDEVVHNLLNFPYSLK